MVRNLIKVLQQTQTDMLTTSAADNSGWCGICSKWTVKNTATGAMQSLLMKSEWRVMGKIGWKCFPLLLLKCFYKRRIMSSIFKYRNIQAICFAEFNIFNKNNWFGCSFFFFFYSLIYEQLPHWWWIPKNNKYWWLHTTVYYSLLLIQKGVINI